MGPTDDQDEMIARRLAAVHARIRAAAVRAGRAPEQIRLLAVSKTHEEAAIRAAYAAGQRAFGESYVQEAIAKIPRLADLTEIDWHFIGQVQANKTRRIATHFHWVHGLADPEHARRLSEQRPADWPALQVCIQVNLSGESTKGGVEPDQVQSLIEHCAALPGLQVRGLMTLPAPVEGEAAQRIPFRALRLLRDRLATPERPLDCLSMGMSDDLEAAILEGATLVRIGTAVFGARNIG
ncbi:MAG: YggS family pyridoxal phosphate-dependent enzyme [Sphingobacteriia bacterium]|nr:YggS family pyridoxal phosphate-dependent enzyme [Sphingobacteriia bacterium]NCC40146.1 YggS family pyridoxal phosphate-dependent enzyme [Gammaproteobacteria bacterium]